MPGWGTLLKVDLIMLTREKNAFSMCMLTGFMRFKYNPNSRM